MGFPTLATNLERVRDEIATVQAREGLDGEVRIVAVTKGHPASAVQAALAARLSDVGENRIQEALGKQEKLCGLPVDWHLIGHVQRNKAKFVPGRFAVVHSVDSGRLAESLQRAVERSNAGCGAQDILVQVNVAGEQQKNGCRPDDLGDIVQRITELPLLHLRGLMTMAPWVDGEREQRTVFAGLRRLREQLEASGIAAHELSMGMTNDYRAAVAEGATILRLGTVLFGARGR